MNQQELFAHYEKIYFHEQQRKEQIFSRLNIPLAVMVAVVGFYAVVVSTDYKKLELGLTIWFWTVLAVSICFLFLGAYFFTDALLGKMDRAIVTPNDLEDWRQQLLAYYAADVDCDSIVTAEIRRKLYLDYMDCASISTINNDRKSSSLYFCNMAVIISTTFAAIAYAIAKFPTL
ncbi:hypothetical protein ACFW0H_27190 [Pseudomonas sp. CR3202]|uniref:hypothetical protein n=1 Tax=Pseudomonas sp. CR3202 TaxID=3351532 RepID=UPI003BEF9E47